MGIGKDIKDMLKWMGIIVFSGGAGIGAALWSMDLQKEHFANMGHGLPLLVEGVHMKDGNHNVVITDQFYKLLSYNSPEDQKLAIDGMKEAYTTLNEYNSKLKFNLCTTVDELATKYNLPKVSGAGKRDIPLYVADGNIDGSKYVLAKTDWTYNTFTYEMQDLSITYKRDALSMVWDLYPTLEETLAPKNSGVYTIAIHETMHAMGFAHVHNKEIESIMQTYVSSSSPKDLTEFDKELLDRYNVQFYGATPTYVKSAVETNPQNSYTVPQVEDEMIA